MIILQGQRKKPWWWLPGAAEDINSAGDGSSSISHCPFLACWGHTGTLQRSRPSGTFRERKKSSATKLHSWVLHLECRIYSLSWNKAWELSALITGLKGIFFLPLTSPKFLCPRLTALNALLVSGRGTSGHDSDLSWTPRGCESWLYHALFFPGLKIICAARSEPLHQRGAVSQSLAMAKPLQLCSVSSF